MNRWFEQLKDAVWRRLLERKPLDWRLPSEIKVLIKNTDDWRAYNQVFVDAEYDFAIAEMLKQTRDRNEIRVLDLGAGNGYFSLYFCDQFIRMALPDLMLFLYAVESPRQNSLELKTRLREIAFNNIKVQTLDHLPWKPSLAGKSHDEPSGYTFDKIDLLRCDLPADEMDFFITQSDLPAKSDRMVIAFHDTLGLDEKIKEAEKRLRTAGFRYAVTLRASETEPLIFYGRQKNHTQVAVSEYRVLT